MDNSSLPATWAILPYPVLERIYSLLPLKNVGRCSQVCWHWYDVFNSDESWRKFVFRDNFLVKRRYTQHSGWQYAMDHMRMRQYIPLMARRWRQFHIEPVANLFNLYDFIQKVTNFCDFYERTGSDEPLSSVKQFRFEWGLHVRDATQSGDIEEKDIGTGGEILRCLRGLLSHFHGLTDVRLEQLQLTSTDANIFMDEILERLQLQLRHLSIVNLTLYQHPSLHLGLFLNLHSLVVSPQHISDNCVQLIAPLARLKIFHIIQDEKTTGASACSSIAWREFSSVNGGRTRLFLMMRGKPKECLLIQPSAPVYGILFERSCGQLSTHLATQICDNYSSTLVRFCQLGLERMRRSNRMELRVDRGAVEMALRCTNMSLFCIRERLSIGTALILAFLSKQHGFKLYLRRNAILKRVCWSRTEVHCLGYGISFEWLKTLARDYDSFEEEIRNVTDNGLCLLSDSRYMSSFRE